MLAYACIGVGDTKGAKDACDRVLATEPARTKDGEYIKQYCRYVCAVLANDYGDYVEQRQRLRTMPRTRLVEDALRVDPLFVRDPSTNSIN